MHAERTSMRLRMLVLAAVLSIAATACEPKPPAASIGTAPVPTVTRAITFPVQGAVRFSDDWGDCRGSGCSRRHEGIDLLGARHTPLVAAATGTVTYLKLEGAGAAGNSLAITDAEGWTYWYIHLNNDTPGTDDGRALPEHVLAPGIAKGSTVTAGQVVAFLGDSGNAESTTPHLHFEIDQPGGANTNPYASLRAAAPAQAVAAPAAAAAAGTVQRPLRRGLSGPDVLAWQNSLVTVMGPRFVPNGVFGPATEATTKEFQATAGLKADGVVGSASRAAMAARLPA
jgi:hypothetical protein